MPFALALIGIVLVIAGARGRNSYSQIKTLLVGDFTGPHNFMVWIFAIMAIGAIGYIKALEGLSRAFLVLIFCALLLANKTFFTQLKEALSGATAGGDDAKPVDPGQNSEEGVESNKGSGDAAGLPTIAGDGGISQAWNGMLNQNAQTGSDFLRSLLPF